MEEKSSYQQKVEAQLEEWKADLEQLKAKAKGMDSLAALSDTSHPHVLWGIRGNFARNVVLAKFRRAAAACLIGYLSALAYIRCRHKV